MTSLKGCHDTCLHGRVGACNTKQHNICKNPLLGAALHHKNEKLVLQFQIPVRSSVLYLSFAWRSCLIKGYAPSKVVFQMYLSSKSSSIKDCLPPKVVLNDRMSSIKYCLPSNFFHHGRSCFIECWPKMLHSGMWFGVCASIRFIFIFYVIVFLFSFKNEWCMMGLIILHPGDVRDQFLHLETETQCTQSQFLILRV